MIVRPDTDGWLIYFHRAHALLSMKIAMAIKPDLWPVKKYWAEGLCSITAHDDGQRAWSGNNHLNKSGAPIDYRDDKSFDKKQAETVVNNAIYRSSFVAYLISMHCHQLYKPFETKEVKSFLEKQKELRKKILKSLDVNADNMKKCYEFLRWCDELSLILCQDDVIENGRKVEIGTLNDLGMVTIHKDKEERLILDPWCFSDPEVEFAAEYFITSKLSYKNDKELKGDLDICNPKKQIFNFTKK